MSWSTSAPQPGPERRALYARCGRNAFLMPNPRRPGDSKYPVISKGSRACKPDCRGLRAAKSRAEQQCWRSTGSIAHARRACAAAKQATAIAKRARCAWARSVKPLRRPGLGRIERDGKKFTPNQLAKMAVIDKGSVWEHYMENFEDEWDVMTDREKIAFNTAGNRQFDRVVKLLDPKDELPW